MGDNVVDYGSTHTKQQSLMKWISSLFATDNSPNIQDPPKDEDLSFLERKRLEEEYLKLKEQKKKAEHYAVEAKQTTQRVR